MGEDIHMMLTTIVQIKNSLLLYLPDQIWHNIKQTNILYNIIITLQVVFFFTKYDTHIQRDLS